MTADPAWRARLHRSLRLPIIVAPMFLVSGPDLVVASCRSGVLGSFPTLNARMPEILDHWLSSIHGRNRGDLPFAANLILHPSNRRREADLDLIIKHRVPVVITSVGSPATVMDRVHGYGGLVLSDVASVSHARKAAAAGADGLILLTAGAGGNTGWLNPFAFIAAVREFYDGLIAVAGCIGRGRELRALQLLGADLGYMGTAFIAAEESMAPAAHKQAAVEATADDILLTDIVSGLPASFIRTRLEEAGVIGSDGQPLQGLEPEIFSYKDVWSAGQGVGSVRSTAPVEAIIRRLERDYRHAGAGLPDGR